MCVIPHLYASSYSSLTQNHAHRMNASQILKHPFITDDPTLPNSQPELSSKIPGASGTPQSEKPERITGICGPSLDPHWASARYQNTNNQSRPMSALTMHFNHLDRRQHILGDIGNRNIRKPNLFNRSLPGRRVASDPVSLKAPYCIAEETSTHSDSSPKSDGSLTKDDPVLLTEVLPATYDIALPFQNSIAPDELHMKPLRLSKNSNKIHRIPPPVSHVYCYRDFFYIVLAAPGEQYPFVAYWNNSPTANKYVVTCAKDPQTRKR